MPWPGATELRIGLGCMRLSTDDDRDDARAGETVAAAVESGITVFDTARAYGRGADDLGHNERLLADALRRSNATGAARIVTKGGMARVGAAWLPDGRAKAIRADCEASLTALGGLPIDLYLIHAPDPRTPWQTSVRALARLVDDGLVRRVGVANVNRSQFDEALELADVAAVQVALSVFDDTALRGGLVQRCVEAGVALIAHSPLGGPRRRAGLARHRAVAEIAAARGVTPAEVALSWLLALSPAVVAIPGARSPAAARFAARAAELELTDDDLTALSGVRRARARPSRPKPIQAGADVVLVMGIPGAGKASVAAELVGQGYVRLNRDERGGSLRELADVLDDELSAGVGRVVLDNTYLTRAARSYVIETAGRHGVPVRCVWVDTPLAQAQINVVERLLDRFGSLPTPEELKLAARVEPGVLAPTSQLRAVRALEPPAADEGFAGVERVPFVRRPPVESRGGIFVAAAVLRSASPFQPTDLAAPHLVFDWTADGNPGDLADLAARLAARVNGSVEAAFCPHGGGPPSCWCRPPLPGLPLAFARKHSVDVMRSTLVGTGPAHRTLAAALGARFVQVS